MLKDIQQNRTEDVLDSNQRPPAPETVVSVLKPHSPVRILQTRAVPGGCLGNVYAETAEGFLLRGLVPYDLVRKFL
jgi:hypothetical protein